MRTVKELSKLTGISARTLHYYDEIGLFTPTCKSAAGYRLYDDKALDTLQEILFFREFDIPLKQIQAVMENPALDRNQILRMQRAMLTAKAQRVERLIASIDAILKGDRHMEFEVFNKNEIEEMYHAMADNMSEEQKQILIDQYGSMDKWRDHFLENASTPEAQKNFAKVAEWYGSKEQALHASTNPQNADIQLAYQNRVDAIMQKLADHKGTDVNSFEVKSLIGEYEFVLKQMFQMEDVTDMMLGMADEFQNNQAMREAQDGIYGDGVSVYIGMAIKAYYKG